MILRQLIKESASASFACFESWPSGTCLREMIKMILSMKGSKIIAINGLKMRTIEKLDNLCFCMNLSPQQICNVLDTINQMNQRMKEIYHISLLYYYHHYYIWYYKKLFPENPSQPSRRSYFILLLFKLQLILPKSWAMACDFKWGGPKKWKYFLNKCRPLWLDDEENFGF